MEYNFHFRGDTSTYDGGKARFATRKVSYSSIKPTPKAVVIIIITGEEKSHNVCDQL